MLWIVASVIFLFLILFIYYKQIKLTCHILYNEDDQLGIRFTLSIFNIRIYKRYVQFELGNSEVLEGMLLSNQIDKQKMIKYIKKTLQLNEHLQVFLKNIKVLNINWKTTVGTGEASSTGVICGGIWMFKSQIIGLISNQSRLLNEPEITVTPAFNIKKVESEMACIGSIRVGKAINIFRQNRKYLLI